MPKSQPVCGTTHPPPLLRRGKRPRVSGCLSPGAQGGGEAAGRTSGVFEDKLELVHTSGGSFLLMSLGVGKVGGGWGGVWVEDGEVYG